METEISINTKNYSCNNLVDIHKCGTSSVVWNIRKFTLLSKSSASRIWIVDKSSLRTIRLPSVGGYLQPITWLKLIVNNLRTGVMSHIKHFDLWVVMIAPPLFLGGSAVFTNDWTFFSPGLYIQYYTGLWCDTGLMTNEYVWYFPLQLISNIRLSGDSISASQNGQTNLSIWTECGNNQ